MLLLLTLSSLQMLLLERDLYKRLCLQPEQYGVLLFLLAPERDSRPQVTDTVLTVGFDCDSIAAGFAILCFDFVHIISGWKRAFRFKGPHPRCAMAVLLVTIFEKL